MQTYKNIFIAFILNLVFAIIEFIGGLLTNSLAILSDSIHDLGDAISIGISFFLEKKSKRGPNEQYTYGYARYSILGALIMTIILIIGSISVFYGAIGRILNPVSINYDGMIILAFFGVIINTFAAYKTYGGSSLNQHSVNLHMLEDVLGWIVVLIGSLIMKFSDINIIDALMSMGVAVFIFICSFKNFKEILDIFLIKLPKNINIREIKEKVLSISGVTDVHHIHVWSIDGITNCATMHVKVSKTHKLLRQEIKDVLKESNITHTTIEIETKDDICQESKCGS